MTILCALRMSRLSGNPVFCTLMEKRMTPHIGCIYILLTLAILAESKKNYFWHKAKKQSHQNKDTKTICWSNHIHIFNANVHFLKACRIATNCQYIKLWVKLHTTQAWCVYYAFDGGKIIIFRCMQTIISQGVDFTAALHPTRAANEPSAKFLQARRKGPY